MRRFGAAKLRKSGHLQPIVESFCVGFPAHEQHRIVYKVTDDALLIAQLRYHY